MLLQFVKFTRTSAGLEKTLRLLQAISHVAFELSEDTLSATRWSLAKAQFGLSRRFFRFLNFIDCFHRVLGLLGGGLVSGPASSSPDGMLMTMIEIGRWSCLGIYIFLEDLTILHAMNVWPVPWNRTVLAESFKFWLYSLAFSLVGTVISLLWSFSGSYSSSSSSAGEKAKSKEKEDEKEKNEEKKALKKAAMATTPPIAPLLRRIIVDGCDILIPGAFLGWIEVPEVVVGLAMVVSTLVAGGEIWSRTV